MIHYTCDRCQLTMDPNEQTRYVVHIDVDMVCEDPALELTETTDDEATDYLADLNETLESEAHHAMLFEDDDEPLNYLNELLLRGDDLNSGDIDDHASGSSSSVELPSKLPASFDLCPDCYAKYTRDPLSRDRAFKMHFSNN